MKQDIANDGLDERTGGLSDVVTEPLAGEFAEQQSIYKKPIYINTATYLVLAARELAFNEV